MELTTDIVIQDASNSAEIFIFEDSTGDGTPDNKVNQVLDDGVNTYTLDFSITPGNDYWWAIDTEIGSTGGNTVVVNSVTISRSIITVSLSEVMQGRKR